MKILIVSSCFFPNLSPRSFRTTELAKEFARLGHDVTVVAKFERYGLDEFLKTNRIKLIPLQGGNRTIRAFEFIQSSKMLVNRVLNRLLYQYLDFPNILLVSRVRKTLSLLDTYDFLISIGAPHAIHWGVNSYLKRKPSFVKTWVADCGDPYMFSALDPFKRPFYFRYFEKSFCRRCAYITVPVEGAKEAYYKQFRDKIKVIPQGFDFGQIKLSVERNSVRPSFAYAGGLSLKGVRNPLPLLRILNELALDFEFHIYSANLDVIPKSMVIELGGKLFLHERLPREQLLHELSKFHFLVNFDSQSLAQVPSKLIDYAYTGRPILNILPNAVDDKLLVEFLVGNYTRALEVKNLRDYDIKNVASSFLSLTIGNR